jgi:hypothetical protein
MERESNNPGQTTDDKSNQDARKSGATDENE